MRHAIPIVVGLVFSALGLVSDAVAQPGAPPIIHRATLHPDAGVVTIAGTGLGAGLLVTVDGQPVPTLPGASDNQLEVLAPATVLTTPGTYRLTVVDPVRRAWDGFVVSSPGLVVGTTTMGAAPPVDVGLAGATSPGQVPVGISSPAGATPASPGSPPPLAIIEDAVSPFRTAIGAQALLSNTTGNSNTAAGFRALALTTTGGFNTAVGAEALEANATGTSNTAVGRQALNTSTSTSFNTAVGSIALFAATGSQNTAVGSNALVNLTTGRYNTAIGIGAGRNTTTGNSNIYVGAEVVGPDTNTIRIGTPYDPAGMPPTGQNATFISGIRGTALSGGEGVYIDAAGRLGSGPVVPAVNTVGSAQVIDASLNAADLAPNAVGTSELGDDVVTAGKVAFNYAASTTEGGAATDLACAGCVAASEVGFTFATLGPNTFLGTQRVDTGNVDLPPSTTTAGNLTKDGSRFLHNAGTQNTYLGLGAGQFAVTGTDNSASGYAALQNTGTGSFNTASGSLAAFNNGSGQNNTGTGYRALFGNVTGHGNTALGANAGAEATSGSYNLFLGTDVIGTAADANTIRIGLPYDSGSGVGQNQTFIAGIHGAPLTGPAVPVFVDANGQLGTVTAPIASGTGTVPPAALPPQLAEQQAINAAQEATIADLRARLARMEARLEALTADGARRR